MKLVKLTKGQYAKVDDSIFDFIDQFTWHCDKGYGVRWDEKGNGKQGKIYMHQVILGYPLNGKEIDHIDNDRSNNQISNLRIVTRRENASNRKRKKEGKLTSKFVGVSWDKKNKKWQSQITLNGIQKKLGRFSDEQQAAEVYQEALKNGGNKCLIGMRF